MTAPVSTPRSFAITLPWPPSVNHIWTAAGRGRRRISDRGQVFRDHVIVLVRNRGGHVLGFAGRLSVELIACPPNRARHDLDNLAKGLLDALQHAGLYLDDAQIDRLVIERGDVIRGGQVLATITEREAA